MSWILEQVLYILLFLLTLRIIIRIYYWTFSNVGKIGKVVFDFTMLKDGDIERIDNDHISIVYEGIKYTRIHTNDKWFAKYYINDTLTTVKYEKQFIMKLVVKYHEYNKKKLYKLESK